MSVYYKLPWLPGWDHDWFPFRVGWANWARVSDQGFALTL